MKVPPEEHFPRFTLDDNEHVCLIAAYVAAGRWQEINLPEGKPQSWFLSFARALKGDRVESINNIFTMLQHVLMAQRKTDFLAIQLAECRGAHFWAGNPCIYTGEAIFGASTARDISGSTSVNNPALPQHCAASGIEVSRSTGIARRTRSGGSAMRWACNRWQGGS